MEWPKPRRDCSRRRWPTAQKQGSLRNLRQKILNWTRNNHTETLVDTAEVFHHQVHKCEKNMIGKSPNKGCHFKIECLSVRMEIFTSTNILEVFYAGDNNDVRLVYDITTIKEMEGGGSDNFGRSCTPTSVSTPTRGIVGDQERKLVSGIRSCMINDSRDLRTSLAR